MAAIHDAHPNVEMEVLIDDKRILIRGKAWIADHYYTVNRMLMASQIDLASIDIVSRELDRACAELLLLKPGVVKKTKLHSIPGGKA